MTAEDTALMGNSAPAIRQRSVSISSESGPSMAATAAREALRAARQYAKVATVDIGLHLHASIWERADFYSLACHIHDRLGLQSRLVAELNAMSNSMTLAIEVAASMMQGRPDLRGALVTAGERFGAPRFPRYSTDFGLVYGDAGAAMLLGRTAGLAQLRSVTSAVDAELEGLNRDPDHNAEPGRPVDLKARKRRWFATHGGPHVVVGRSIAKVQQVVDQALRDAAASLSEARWVLLPFLGERSVHQQYLAPLGVPRSKTLIDLGLRLGHLGAADPAVGLQHLVQTRQITAGDLVVVITSGVGMTWSAVVLEITGALDLSNRRARRDRLVASCASG